MPTAKAEGLVLRGTDYSETSRIATIWTREFGKTRVLAKGARRPKSAFESALDLLTHCSIVLIRKTGGGLDLLTEARALERFAGLRRELAALYAGYYVAELLCDLTQDDDPHPALFDEALATLRDLGQPGVNANARLLRFETALLRELGYEPQLEACAGCRKPLPNEPTLLFSAAAGGLICGECRTPAGGRWRLSAVAVEAWRKLLAEPEHTPSPGPTTRELRGALGSYVSHLLGRRPRTLAFLEK